VKGCCTFVVYLVYGNHFPFYFVDVTPSINFYFKKEKKEKKKGGANK
jgi:hypothetical protein